MLLLETPCPQEAGDDGDGNRSCIYVETGRRNILEDDSLQANSKQKCYSPPLHQAACVHKRIPTQNPQLSPQLDVFGQCTLYSTCPRMQS